jgi:flagellar hook protein FlgE
MALSNTLFAGLSGLDANQTKLNVAGNNIANANTTAFKSTRALFKPQFYLTDSGGSGPDTNFGGENPSQRGLGVEVSALQKNMNGGSIETTGKDTDLAIDGDGFFIVKSDEQKYTRDGSFNVNPNNKLVTNGGEFVQGYSVDANYNLGSQLGDITIPLGTATTAQSTRNMSLAGNLNGAGTIAGGASVMGTQYMMSATGTFDPTTLLTDLQNADGSAPFAAGDVLTLQGQKGGTGNLRTLAPATLSINANTSVQDLMDFFQQGLGINTSAAPTNPNIPPPGVSLEADPNDATMQRLVFVGNEGAENALTLPPTSLINQTTATPMAFGDITNVAGFTSDPTGESIHGSMVAYDSLGTPVNIDLTMVLESTSNTGSQWRFFAESPTNVGNTLAIGTGTLNFDNQGKLLPAPGATLDIDRSGTGAASPLAIKLDFSGMTALTNSGKPSELVMSQQDGSSMGRLTSFSIGIDGKITGKFNNGTQRLLGQVALASFANVQGLVDRGSNMFVEGADSGAAVIGGPGTFGTGKIVSQSLEMSNVDLSEEFINLIIASTGFSASSRVITTSNQLLTDLLNSTR